MGGNSELANKTHIKMTLYILADKVHKQEPQL